MIRKIIMIDDKKCTGCGLCAAACHEGAIGMINGKAKLRREDFCDGLGDCLPACPAGAIAFEEREAPEYDHAAVLASKTAGENGGGRDLPCGCPGTQTKRLEKTNAAPVHGEAAESELAQWPVQLKLVPVNAPYFEGANLLVAADCTAFAYGGFHRQFIRNHITLIGCPKLDEGDYADKLTEILRHNGIKSVAVARMEAPCCGGLENAVKRALLQSGKVIPLRVVTITADGRIISE